MITAIIITRPAWDQFERVDHVKEFTGQPYETGDERWWILGAPMVVRLIETDTTADHVEVPTGFITDGASVPKAAQLLTSWKPWNPPQRWAGIAHDWLYHVPGYDKDRADQVFLALLAAEGAPWFRQRAMYRAVKHFGHRAYRRNQAAGPDGRIYV